MVQTPPIPALTPRESYLFAIFRDLLFNPFDLLQSGKLSATEYFAFIKSPAVLHHLAAIQSDLEAAFARRAEQLKASAEAILAQLPNSPRPNRNPSFQAPSLREGVGGWAFRHENRSNHT